MNMMCISEPILFLGSLLCNVIIIAIIVIIICVVVGVVQCLIINVIINVAFIAVCFIYLTVI